MPKSTISGLSLLIAFPYSHSHAQRIIKVLVVQTHLPSYHFICISCVIFLHKKLDHLSPTIKQTFGRCLNAPSEVMGMKSIDLLGETLIVHYAFLEKVLKLGSKPRDTRHTYFCITLSFI